MFTRILVPTDFSPSADAALALAHERFPDASVCLLHVIDPQKIARAMSSSLQAAEARKAIESERLGQLWNLARRSEECLVVVGKAVDTILQQAELWRPELIIMGTHGRTGLAHFLNGSIAEAVVRHARWPVLIVHEKGASRGE